MSTVLPSTLPCRLVRYCSFAPLAVAYGVFFGSIWVLSSVMSPVRLAAVSVLSVVLLVAWLVTTNGLWTHGATHRHSSRLERGMAESREARAQGGHRAATRPSTDPFHDGHLRTV